MAFGRHWEDELDNIKMAGPDDTQYEEKYEPEPDEDEMTDRLHPEWHWMDNQYVKSWDAQEGTNG